MVKFFQIDFYKNHKETIRPAMNITAGGVLTVSVSVPDKGDIWVSVFDPKQNKIISDAGNWVQNAATGLYDLNLSADVFQGKYTVVLENSDSEPVSYTLKTRFTPAPVLENNKRTSFSLDRDEKRLYCIKATANGYFNIQIPSGNPSAFDLYLFDATGKQLDDDDSNPDWNNGKLNWNTVNIKAGTYYLRLSNGSQAYANSITVSAKVPANSIKLNKTKVTLKKKKSFKIKTTLAPANTTDTLAYKTSNKKVATVSKTGKITAKKKGKAVITVSASSGKKAKIKVTVK